MSLNRLLVSLLCAGSLFISSVSAQTFPLKKRKKNIPGQRAIIYDERLSALRTRPEIKAALISRLHRDREVGIIGAPRSLNGGPRFYPIAISRSVRGWIIAEALARPQQGEDAKRLKRLINETRDDFARARLARLYVDHFSSSTWAPRALMIVAQAAEQVADRLSRDAKKRVGDSDEGLDKNLEERDYLLNYVGLDRYNKLGITFDYDSNSERLIYDGGAYREILKKYPHSPEAIEARTQLENLRQKIQK